ncbi:MAG: hypothetical protein M5U01_39740 [Ardenticatenaceae bacterium]|nr:hypothetical protein [Ardenticatenaceae bacterium]
MTLDEILQDIHTLEEDLTTYERKYGVLSETFYESYVNGEEPADDAWVLDWTRWASTYKVWLRRREQYRAAMETLRSRSLSLSEIIEKSTRYESLPIPV